MEATTAATSIEQLGTKPSRPTVRQHLAAIRQLFDYLTPAGILGGQPAGLGTRTKVGGREVLRRH